MRCVALDFETTGVAAGFPNEPWQLGIVAIEDGRVLADSAYETLFRIDADRPFSPRAPGRWASIRDELAAAPAFMDIWPEIAGRICGVPLVAHNAATERKILEHMAPLTGFGPWIDTLCLSRKRWPRLGSYALGDLAGTLGFADETRAACPGRDWHDALFDAFAGAFLFCRLEGLARECAMAGTGGW